MGDKSRQDVLIYAVGDVGPDRDDPTENFRQVAPLLRSADIAFCQLEVNLATRGTRLPQARHTVLVHPKATRAIRDAGFNVVSFAGNHCMDWGREAFLDTLENLKKEEISVVGVGGNIMEARRPAIFDLKGSRIAFLAYNTILPMCYWAEENRPGCAPMRAWTHYEQIEHDQPGTPCRIHTFPHEDDLRAMIDDIREAKSKADVIILSIHWGIHFIPAVLAAYQRDVAHAAIDAGADLILGHHAHILKGVEVYKGKAVFYSLCNFAMDLRMDKAHAEASSFKEIQKLNPDWIPDFEALYNFPTDSQKTAVVKAVVCNGSLKDISFLPTFVNKKTAEPEIVKAGDSRFDAVIRYMEQITRDADLSTTFTLKGDEVFPS